MAVPKHSRRDHIERAERVSPRSLGRQITLILSFLYIYLQILEASFLSYYSIVPEIKNKNGYLTKKEQVEDLQKRNGVNIKKN